MVLLWVLRSLSKSPKLHSEEFPWLLETLEKSRIYVGSSNTENYMELYVKTFNLIQIYVVYENSEQAKTHNK